MGLQAQSDICPICHDDHWPDRPCKSHDIAIRIATLEAEIARLRKALVWAVKNDVEALGIGPVDIFRYGTHIATCRDNDASMIETLCRLAEGE